jgi:hypothetical protein
MDLERWRGLPRRKFWAIGGRAVVRNAVRPPGRHPRRGTAPHGGSPPLLLLGTRSSPCFCAMLRRSTSSSVSGSGAGRGFGPRSAFCGGPPRWRLSAHCWISDSLFPALQPAQAGNRLENHVDHIARGEHGHEPLAAGVRPFRARDHRDVRPRPIRVASSFPVDRLCADFDAIFAGFKTMVVGLSDGHQLKLFHDDALRFCCRDKNPLAPTPLLRPRNPRRSRSTSVWAITGIGSGDLAASAISAAADLSSRGGTP